MGCCCLPACAAEQRPHTANVAPASVRVSRADSAARSNSDSHFSKSKSQNNLKESSIEVVIAAAEQLQLNGILTTWQRDWCTPEVVEVYLKGRKGDVGQAAGILSQALHWRQKHHDVLSGMVTPHWQGDMRVLARGEHGHPLVYLCTKHQPSRAKTADLVNHMAAVLEAAVQSMEGCATQMDILMDCHGFRVSSNLNPAPVIAFAEMLKHPFRDRLRFGYVVDSPSAFDVIWKVGQRVLPPVTRRKIFFLTHEQAKHQITKASGKATAEVAADVMVKNRESADGKPPSHCLLPSEDLGIWQGIPHVASRAQGMETDVPRIFSEVFDDLHPEDNLHHWLCSWAALSFMVAFSALLVLQLDVTFLLRNPLGSLPR